MKFIVYCCSLMQYVGLVTASLWYMQPLPFSFYWFVYQDFIWCIQNTLFFSVPLSQTIDHGRVHYSDVTMSVMACQITRRFIQIFIWANITENIKARVAGPLWREPPVICAFSHKGTITRKPSPWRDVIIFVPWRHHASEINSKKFVYKELAMVQTSEFIFQYVNGTQYRCKPHDQM